MLHVVYLSRSESTVQVFFTLCIYIRLGSHCSVNPATSLYLSQARNWISKSYVVVFFDVQWVEVRSDYSWNFWPSLFKPRPLEAKNISKSLVATVKLSKWWLQQGTFRSVVDIMIGTTSSEISYQMRDIYTPYTGAIYILKVHNHISCKVSFLTGPHF